MFFFPSIFFLSAADVLLRDASVHLAFPPTGGLPVEPCSSSNGGGNGLLLPQWCWQRHPIPVAWGKCICLRLNGCSYCLLISPKPFRPLLQPLWHPRLFTCIVLFPATPRELLLSFLSHLTPTLPVSPVATHACRRWDIAFLILLTGANIYVLFFNIHSSCSRRTAGPSWDTRSTAPKKKEHGQLPCLRLFLLFTRFPLPENLPLRS